MYPTKGHFVKPQRATSRGRLTGSEAQSPTKRIHDQQDREAIKDESASKTNHSQTNVSAVGKNHSQKNVSASEKNQSQESVNKKSHSQTEQEDEHINRKGKHVTVKSTFKSKSSDKDAISKAAQAGIDESINESLKKKDAKQADDAEETEQKGKRKPNMYVMMGALLTLVGLCLLCAVGAFLGRKSDGPNPENPQVKDEPAAPGSPGDAPSSRVGSASQSRRPSATPSEPRASRPGSRQGSVSGDQDQQPGVLRA